ncbi:uncharacterized protein MELLADRAFT_95150 [Melampsora larici-populina 98AG31]|uniref:Uncharacterized protein n=1 Tax=Melampsora larici-populina (strain 98AG31 / pathotype 3-4-7) TaxID=747676 RepID=F4RCA4_MELLP|nr:uncharacterized protein MELLADRAFT_95150 [Melampsora larici-populina 98AG31]EGG09985.1 hypothetical protein MELLADRAFT_95150 [Melampsora larici-populina 98AG31]
MSNYHNQTQISPDSHVSDPAYNNYYGPSTQNPNTWNYGQPVPRTQATVNPNSGLINPSNPGFVYPGYLTYYTAGAQVNPGPALTNPAPNPNQSLTGGQVNPGPALPNHISSSAPSESQASKTSHRKRKDQNKQTELHATSSKDSNLVNAILQLHKEIKTLKAIKALKLGTTVSYIDQVFGKYIAVHQPLAWNYFLRCDVAKAIFKAASGISNGTAMKILSQEWRMMDKKDKQVYKDLAKAGGSLCSDVQVEPTETDLETLEKDLKVINVGSQSRSNIVQPCTNILANPCCLKQYKNKAKQLLEETSNHVSI